jgi:hypothetical protein
MEWQDEPPVDTFEKFESNFLAKHHFRIVAEQTAVCILADSWAFHCNFPDSCDRFPDFLRVYREVFTEVSDPDSELPQISEEGLDRVMREVAAIKRLNIRRLRTWLRFMWCVHSEFTGKIEFFQKDSLNLLTYGSVLPDLATCENPSVIIEPLIAARQYPFYWLILGIKHPREFIDGLPNLDINQENVLQVIKQMPKSY